MTKAGMIPLITDSKLRSEMKALSICNEFKNKGFNPDLDKIGNLLCNQSNNQASTQPFWGSIQMDTDTEYNFWSWLNKSNKQ